MPPGDEAAARRAQPITQRYRRGGRAALMEILLTGGSGFIGGHLARALAEAGHRVRIYDLRAPADARDSHVADVRDADALARALAGVDLVVHLAAEHADDVQPVQRYFDTNVGGARALAAAMARTGVDRLVHYSSVSVYGDGDTDEQRSDLRPTTPYGESKRQAEQVLMDWQAAAPARRALRILRPCVVYGPGHHGNLRRWMRELERPRPWRIGDGRQLKSVAYVGNVVAATLCDLATRAGVVVHNVVDGPDLSVAALERLILDALGREGVRPRVVPPLLALAAATLFDAHAALTGARHAISRARVRKYCTGTPVRQGALYHSGFVAPYDHRAGLIATIAADPDRVR